TSSRIMSSTIETRLPLLPSTMNISEDGAALFSYVSEKDQGDIVKEFDMLDLMALEGQNSRLKGDVVGDKNIGQSEAKSQSTLKGWSEKVKSCFMKEDMFKRVWWQGLLDKLRPGRNIFDWDNQAKEPAVLQPAVARVQPNAVRGQPETQNEPAGDLQALDISWHQRIFFASAELKFNCLFLMPVVDKLPALLREDLESAFEDDLDNIFDITNLRHALGSGNGKPKAR
ncbi:dynamin-like protein ARC5, partial [Tanacetum coccineum]